MITQRLLFTVMTMIWGGSWLITAQNSGRADDQALPHREVAVTLDDLPTVRVSGGVKQEQVVTRKLLAALTAHRVSATGFVNENKLYQQGQTDTRIGLLRMWLDAGMALGNHTFSHPDLNTTTLSQYEDDIIRGDVITRWLLQQREKTPRYFRCPCNHTGQTEEVKAGLTVFLKERNYQLTPFTVECSDYLFNTVYIKAKQTRNIVLIRRIQTAYLDFTEVMFDYFEHRSRQVLGYEVKQVFLIHANILNADCLGELLQRLQRRGYSFISLDQALADQAYQIQDGYVGKQGLSWVHRWAASLGTGLNNRDEPDPPQSIMDLFKSD